MRIIKRDNTFEEYNSDKIKNTIIKAFNSQTSTINEDTLNKIIKEIENKLVNDINVERIQDIIEEKLMAYGFYKEARAYIVYREKHHENRHVLNEITRVLNDKEIYPVLKKIQRDFNEDVYDLKLLLIKLNTLSKDAMSKEYAFKILLKASIELVTKEAPKWEYIAARFLTYHLNLEVELKEENYGLNSFYEKIKYLTINNYYGSYILEYYSKSEIDILEAYIKEERNNLFTYSGLELVIKRYLIRNNEGELLEKTQEMFMGISMHLAMLEKDKVRYAKEFYDMLSSLKVTMATPTISNSRKPFHQMSSCFIDTVDDSLKGIYKSLDNFARVSKYGGGMGLYFGKVRANGSDIRGYKNAAGGIIRWLRLVNDTAVAVDQLGVRAGACAVYLDAWHRDLPEFLQIRTNNGDDRMKAHDIFPAVCYPDLFWKLAKENLNASWYLMCPHEISTIKGYNLEDYYGDEWEERYYECVYDKRINKREMLIKDVVRLIIKSAVETGTPFIFNRDITNRMNPNKDKGMIYCSNLCTEIAQNMSSIKDVNEEIIEVNGQKIVVDKYRAGDFVVCNLASLVLGNIDVTDDDEIKHLTKMAVRALDNVIDLNYYPIPYAKITNGEYRPIGLGTSGYHHMLAKNGISFESDEHLEFTDKLYEKINYYALSASLELSREKGRYKHFKGSDFDSGEYFKLRNYTDKKWQKLHDEIKKDGLRNGYIMAIAPTSSTSIIAGTTASIDPVMNKFFIEEKKGMMITRVAPDLNPKTFWLYKNAHLIDQKWLIKAAGVRARHIDQAQSVNIYITNEYTFKQLLNLYIYAYEMGVKTLYYVRSKSLEISECESCSA